MNMTKNMIERVLNECDCMLKTQKTVREIAKIFNVSKSTVHKDLQERLLEIDADKHREIKKILQFHTEIRHIRGGESTKLKFMVKNSN